jgi:hypothetical protein
VGYWWDRNSATHQISARVFNSLLDAYKRSVSLFTTAERNMRGLAGDDFHVALKELARLHETCMNANSAVTEH